MKRYLIPAVAVFGVILAVTCIVRDRHDRSVAEYDPDVLPHLFVPDDQGERHTVHCDFSHVETRATLFKTWGRPLEQCSVGDGWTHPSEAGIRAFGRRSSIEIFAVNQNPASLLMTLRGVPHRKSDRRQRVDVFVNGANIGTRDVPFEWTTLRFDLPEDTARRGINKVEFSFAYRTSTNKEKEQKGDPRRFAADLLDITLIERDETALSDNELKAIARRAGRSADTRPRVFNRDTGRFHISDKGMLILPISVPAGSNRLEVELNAPPGVDDSSLPVDVTVRVIESSETWRPKLPPWQRRPDGRGLQSKGAIPVARCAGVRCVVTMTIDPKPVGTAIEIVPPIPLGEPPPAPDRTNPGISSTQPADVRPDIVLIILDAARYDHFSFAGYGRNTTPNIDRLAAESVVFSNVFALAPYTMCSVPTMVSGLSFLEHGVTERGRALAPGTATLAERLRGVGYRTLAFSTNPNNSRAVGTDQGYDEFHELWNEEGQSLAMDPKVTTRRVLEKLASIDDSRPMHLQVHYMPPHAPYDPAPEFDVFTDPAYDGPCDGSNRTINKLDSGRLSPADGCLEQVIGLYDGGLLAADASVGRLIDALRQRPRWKQTVVLVTSDHGEAFLEHGRTSHNSTVYDEMLHVPFVLRLPEGLDVRPADTGRLATLSDIVPTLLAAASVQPTAPSDGINLIEATPVVGGLDDRSFVARTTGGTPDYGFRSTRWKVILTGSGHGMLFNLERDPGENSNLGFVNLPVYFAVGDLLTRRLAAPIGIESFENDLPSSDREMLEALGYVE